MKRKRIKKNKNIFTTWDNTNENTFLKLKAQAKREALQHFCMCLLLLIYSMILYAMQLLLERWSC